MMVIHLSRAGIWKDNDHFDDGDDIEFDKYKNMGILHQYKSRFSIFFFKETTMFCVTRSSDVSWKHNIIDYDNCDVDDDDGEEDNNTLFCIWKEHTDDNYH